MPHQIDNLDTCWHTEQSQMCPGLLAGTLSGLCDGLGHLVYPFGELTLHIFWFSVSVVFFLLICRSTSKFQIIHCLVTW